MTVLANIAALRLETSASPGVITVEGYTIAGDGGGGDFVYVTGLSTADNGVTIIVDANGHRWQRMYSGLIDVRWAGAKCDGATDDSAAVASAAAVGPISFAAGACYIDTTSTIDAYASAWPGQIKVESGVTLTFNMGFDAPIEQVFINGNTGPGTVVFNPQFFATGYPEWWGAVTNNLAIDCAPAINAAIVACPVTQLQAATYYTLSTVQFSTAYHRLAGGGAFPKPSATISIQSATLDTILVGLTSQPANTSLYLMGASLSGITATRSIPPAPPTTGFGGSNGVRCQWVGAANISNVVSAEHTNGFYMKGVVYSTFAGIYASRANAGNPTTNDYFAGILYDDTAPPEGLNEDNASVYINQIGVGGTAAVLINYGFYSINAFTDLYITQLETAGCQVGAAFNGSTVGDTYPSENLHLSNFSLDQVRNGIIINNGNKETAISIVECQMFIPASSGAGQGISVINTPITGKGGGISIVGCQIGGGGGASTGIYVDNSYGVITRGNVIWDVNFPITVSTGGNCSFSDLITNPSITNATFGAITLSNCTRTVVDCIIYGASGAFATGVDLTGTGNTYNEVRCSGIDAACVSGGSVNKLVSDGTHIVSAGTFSINNLAQGILA